MGKVLAVCISPRRGTVKENVTEGYFELERGLAGDAHAGSWHRQVSLLDAGKVRAFLAGGAELPSGAFGENLLTEGIDLGLLSVGTLLRCGQALLEVTQIGKECHAPCEIHRRMGDCIMPREGIFARVLRPGAVRVGDEIAVEPRAGPWPWQAAVVTVSDRGAAGLRRDESGPVVAERLREMGCTVAETLLLPDDHPALAAALKRLCDRRRLDLILTTGGTGFSPRDITPEATLAVAHRLAPGIAEAIRAASMAVTPQAMLSRGVSVIRGRTLIVNLPGSPKACIEYMDVFLPVLPHALGLLRGETADCARP